MELRTFATRILSADTLEEKLLEPEELTDHSPGDPLFWEEPTRPPGMYFQKHTRKDKLPRIDEHHHAEKRAICLHRFAGHELLAVEIMAYALLAFPNAPRHFRRGIANTLKEEQQHVRLYMNRLKAFGLSFGDLPLYKHFWHYIPFLRTPEEYISVMSLTFEMANLDFAPIYGASFEKHGDTASAELMKQILRDEIAHVSFGWNWLKKFKKEEDSMWNAWLDSIPEKLSLNRAKGPQFHEEHRIKAGISKEWIQQYHASERF